MNFSVQNWWMVSKPHDCNRASFHVSQNLFWNVTSVSNKKQKTKKATTRKETKQRLTVRWGKIIRKMGLHEPMRLGSRPSDVLVTSQCWTAGAVLKLSGILCNVEVPTPPPSQCDKVYDRHEPFVNFFSWSLNEPGNVDGKCTVMMNLKFGLKNNSLQRVSVLIC